MIYVYEGCCGKSSLERVCSYGVYCADPSFCCPQCGRSLAQVLTCPQLINCKTFEPFKSPVDGSVIASQHDLAEHNKRNNVVNLHDGYDEAAVQSFTKRDWNATPEKERTEDLKKDMEIAVQKLEDGYKPTPAKYTEEIPDA